MSEYRVIVTDQLQSVLAGHDGVSYQSPPQPHRPRARARPRAGRTRAPPRRTRPVAPGPPRRHPNRPNRAGTMTATAPAQSRWRASARQLPAHARRTRTRRATARDPLRAPPRRHGPPVHRRPQRARRLATHPAPRVSNRRLRRRVPAQPPLRRPQRDRPLAPRVRRDRRTGRPRPTPRLPASAHSDRVLGTPRARSRVLHPVRADHGARARASESAPRVRTRRRPSLGRRGPHSEAAVFVESQVRAARRRSS